MAEFRHETDRLVLRDWREEDWEPFFEGTNTPAVMQWLGGLLDDERKSDVRARLERYQSDFGHTFWVVERKEDGAILGFCGLKRCTDENGPFGEMEAGWRLREDAWGKGYAKEAARAAIDIGFTKFGADPIIALTVEGNAASWGLMVRLGMERRRDLDFEDALWSHGYGPVIVHAITREQWDRQGA
ncbi:GNAT family N-acetyltransferase [Erythrobacter sp. KY5]|uniref:GNAT family N-acetyltransferase n=1 Tax=Erythrobacter sp. KY5 TaxID=2011159 RepID=UPI000DBF1CED|nr:GNAT family N-acetyltransferase [Erythrobacter sp. KY5]AWW73183.1 GNAT family N-acetyltransferase [Erythrobacter sp. KY5]